LDPTTGGIAGTGALLSCGSCGIYFFGIRRRKYKDDMMADAAEGGADIEAPDV